MIVGATQTTAELRAVDDDELTELLLAAQAGDQWKLATFIRHTQHSVGRLVAHLGANGEAEDLTQEVYIRAMRSLDSYEARCPARYWLMSIARRVAVDSVRSRDRRERLRRAVRMNRKDVVVDLETGTDVAALLGLLDSDRRSAFVLTQVLGYSYEEAAEVCGCALGTIRSRVARARAQLVDAWSDA